MAFAARSAATRSAGAAGVGRVGGRRDASGRTACSTRSISRSCSSVNSMLVPQFQQSATASHKRTDMGARQSGQAQRRTPSASQNCPGDLALAGSAGAWVAIRRVADRTPGAWRESCGEGAGMGQRRASGKRRGPTRLTHLRSTCDRDLSGPYFALPGNSVG